MFIKTFFFYNHVYYLLNFVALLTDKQRYLTFKF